MTKRTASRAALDAGDAVPQVSWMVVHEDEGTPPFWRLCTGRPETAGGRGGNDRHSTGLRELATLTRGSRLMRARSFHVECPPEGTPLGRVPVLYRVNVAQAATARAAE